MHQIQNQNAQTPSISKRPTLISTGIGSSLCLTVIQTISHGRRPSRGADPNERERTADHFPLRFQRKSARRPPASHFAPAGIASLPAALYGTAGQQNHVVRRPLLGEEAQRVGIHHFGVGCLQRSQILLQRLRDAALHLQQRGAGSIARQRFQPNAPLPAKQSGQLASTIDGASQLNSVSRTRSVVGRKPGLSGTGNFRPRH